MSQTVQLNRRNFTAEINKAELVSQEEVPEDTGHIPGKIWEYYLSRFFAMLLPLWLGIIWMGKTSVSVWDKDRTRQQRLLRLLLWVADLGILNLILTWKKPFWNTTMQNCLTGYMPDFVRWTAGVLLFSVIVTDWGKARDFVTCFLKNNPAAVHIGAAILSGVNCCLIVELLCASKMDMIPVLAYFNILYWILAYVFLYLLSGRNWICIMAVTACAWLVGFANYIVYQFRGSYITFGDLTVVRTALEVADNYRLYPDRYLFLSILPVIGNVVLLLFELSCQKRYIRITGPSDIAAAPVRFRKFVKRMALEIVFCAGVYICYRNGFLYYHVAGVSWDYNLNIARTGYIAYFLSNMNATVDVDLENYSAQKAADILEEVPSREGTGALTKTKAQNIIVIQNEAFSDMAVTAAIETNEPVFPTIDSLQENTVKGYVNLSITGGPTGNSEFEFLTGGSLLYVPYGSIPYTQYIKTGIPSIAEVLKKQEKSFTTVAYHSYYASGYSRNSVYDCMGFDRKIFENDFSSQRSADELVRDLVSDKADYNTIIQEYEAKEKGEPLFLFNVTIQNHGGYTDNSYEFETPIHVTNFEGTEALNTYLSLMRLSDQAFASLIDYFSKAAEPTIILMYGDHQPSWDDATKELLAEHPAYEDAELQMLSQYYVPYIIWSNYELEERDDWNSGGITGTFNQVSLNYLSSILLDYAGAELSDYNRYLLNLHEQLPAVTALGYWDTDGMYHALQYGAVDQPLLQEYEMIQYNYLFDTEQKLWDHFLP